MVSWGLWRSRARALLTQGARGPEVGRPGLFLLRRWPPGKTGGGGDACGAQPKDLDLPLGQRRALEGLEQGSGRLRGQPCGNGRSDPNDPASPPSPGSSSRCCTPCRPSGPSRGPEHQDAFSPRSQQIALILVSLRKKKSHQDENHPISHHLISPPLATRPSVLGLDPALMQGQTLLWDTGSQFPVLLKDVAPASRLPTPILSFLSTGSSHQHTYYNIFSLKYRNKLTKKVSSNYCSLFLLPLTAELLERINSASCLHSLIGKSSQAFIRTFPLASFVKVQTPTTLPFSRPLLR